MVDILRTGPSPEDLVPLPGPPEGIALDPLTPRADAALDPAVEPGAEQVLASACPLDCPDACSLEVRVQDGRVTRIGASPNNLLTRGFICTKVARFADHLDSPERLLHPAVRRGPKGAGRFEQVSWDEALGLLAERLARSASATAARPSCRSPTAARTASSPRTPPTPACSTAWAPRAWAATSVPRRPSGRRRASTAGCPAPPSTTTSMPG